MTTQRNVLIEDGILKGYIQDAMNARLMGVKPTGNGRRESYAHVPMPRMTNTYMLGGDKAPEEIVASIKKGLYATNFGGGQVDITSGKFVFSASQAYWVENGQIQYPVKGATLVGSGPESLKKISMIGNDMQLDSGVGTCGKEGQSVPVGVGSRPCASMGSPWVAPPERLRAQGLPVRHCHNACATFAAYENALQPFFWLLLLVLMSPADERQRCRRATQTETLQTAGPTARRFFFTPSHSNPRGAFDERQEHCRQRCLVCAACRQDQPDRRPAHQGHHRASAARTPHPLLPHRRHAGGTRSSTRRASRIHNILHGQDDRLLVIIGPCSIHDPAAALDYARRLKPLREKYADTLEIVMRVYFEKPRTTVGWKGLINDPYLDESYRIDEGLRIARQLLIEINRQGLPAGSASSWT